MNFREYRPKQTIRAAEITEDVLHLQPARPRDGESTAFGKGDYVENVNGELFGWKKAEFESAYIATRAPRQVKANKGKKKPLVNHGARVTDGVIV